MHYSLEYLGLLQFLRVYSCCIMAKRPCRIFSVWKITQFPNRGILYVMKKFHISFC